jgi:hypothetical protein
MVVAEVTELGKPSQTFCVVLDSMRVVFART